jgi:hypothetical protein
MKAIWNDKIIAESDDTVVIEGNHYFPLACVRREYLRESSSRCGLVLRLANAGRYGNQGAGGLLARGADCRFMRA